MLFPIIGNMAIAIVLNRKITPKDVSSWFGFALISGEIAAIAVAPHIAVPDVISIDNFGSILKIFEIKMPKLKTITTKIEMYGKYVLVKLRALDAEIVSPRIIIPA
jgi:hypothetical protein